MIKAEINNNRVKMDISGELSTILGEMHSFVEDILSNIESATGESKHQLLLLLTQNILKEWSEENETDGN